MTCESTSVCQPECQKTGPGTSSDFNPNLSCKTARSTRASLLEWSQLPPHLQFNKYILRGYRPLGNIIECITSLFYFHNETINILTHGIPIAYFFLFYPSLLPWEQITIPWLPYLHLLSTVSPWIGSFIYHLFMPHHAGHGVYKRLLQLDMFGIWITQSLGALTTVTASSYCLLPMARNFVIGIYCVTCAYGLYKAVEAGTRSPWDRRLCFLLPVLIRIMMLGLRSTSQGGGHPDAYIHVWLQDGIAIFGGVIGALRIPEKWFPGRFDFFFNSHNLMHVLVVIAIIHMHWAARYDLVWMSEGHCPIWNSVGAPKQEL